MKLSEKNIQFLTSLFTENIQNNNNLGDTYKKLPPTLQKVGEKLSTDKSLSVQEKKSLQPKLLPPKSPTAIEGEKDDTFRLANKLAFDKFKQTNDKSGMSSVSLLTNIGIKPTSTSDTIGKSIAQSNMVSDKEKKLVDLSKGTIDKLSKLEKTSKSEQDLVSKIKSVQSKTKMDVDKLIKSKTVQN